MEVTGKAISNISSSLYKKLLSVSFVVFPLFLNSCGKQEMACSPNFVQGGFGALVSYSFNNDFQFEVCYNDSFLDKQISVYGFQSQSDIATINLATDVRLPHMVNGLHPGDIFTVTFNNDDAWFAIFEDDNLGNFSSAVQILRGQFR
jgi:hypothetical protein